MLSIASLLAEELDQMRAEQQARGESPRYDGRGLNLSADEVQRRLAAGEAHVYSYESANRRRM